MGDRYPIKLTVTYNDHSTEDFDVFIAAVSMDLIPSGKGEDGEILYSAGESFSTQSMAHVAATPIIIMGLIKAMTETMEKMIESMPPGMMTEFLEAALTSNSKIVELYRKSGVERFKKG